MTKSKTNALDTFVVLHTETTEALEILSGYMADHCDLAVEEVNWSHVGSLGHVNTKLNELVEFISNQ